MLLVAGEDSLSKEYWDGLQTKEELYAVFDKVGDQVPVPLADMECYYKDGEFKAVAASVKEPAEKLLAVLPDILEHFAGGLPDRWRNKAEEIYNEMNLDLTDGMAICAGFLSMALDTSNEKSFVKRVESGNGIPEIRAEYRAYTRYKEFKAKDKARLEAFKRTPEYKMQAMELKLGLRDHIDMPESEEN